MRGARCVRAIGIGGFGSSLSSRFVSFDASERAQRRRREHIWAPAGQYNYERVFCGWVRLFVCVCVCFVYVLEVKFGESEIHMNGEANINTHTSCALYYAFIFYFIFAHMYIHFCMYILYSHTHCIVMFVIITIVWHLSSGILYHIRIILS